MENEACVVRPIIAAGSPALHRAWRLSIHPDESAPTGWPPVRGAVGAGASRVTVTVSGGGAVVNSVSVTGAGVGEMVDDDGIAPCCRAGAPETPPGRRKR